MKCHVLNTEVFAFTSLDMEVKQPRILCTHIYSMIQQFSAWLAKKHNENPRMRTLLVGILN